MVRARDLDAMERRARRLVRRRERAARDGLVKEPYCRPHFWADVAPRGQYLAIHERNTRKCPNPPQGRRGRITEFSRRSRSRMLKCIARTNRALLSRSLLVTLTYPRTYSMESSIYKRHFKRFRERLTATFPAAAAVWKLEFQKRGAPHYHLLIVGLPFLARQWLAKAWYEVVGSSDIRHLHAGTQVVRCNSPEKACRYAAKYVAKVSDSPSAPEFTGRIWGVIRRAALDQHVVQWELERSGFERLLSAIRDVVTRGARAVSAEWDPMWCFLPGGRATRLVAWAAGLDWSAV
jgi:hypothetical protein